MKKYTPLIFFVVIGNLFLNSLATKVKANVSNLEGEIGIEYLKRKKEDFYLLGPGDILSIRFIEPFSVDIYSDNSDPENRLFGINEFTIDGDGYILLPRISKVYVEGLTITELKKLLEKSYKEFIKRPMIEISITNFRPINVYIEGEVVNSGLYTLPGRGEFVAQLNDNKVFYLDNVISGLDNTEKNKVPNIALFPKLFDLIKISGGITLYSDISNIKIIRNNPISKGGGKIEANINFLNVIENGDKTQNIRLLDGDRIIVQKSDIELDQQLSKALKSNLNPKYLDVFVTGRVENRGKITVDKSSTLNDAIQLAGGIKVLRGPVELTRYNSDGKIEKRKFGFSPNAKRGSYKNPYLKAGDIVSVGKGPLIKTNEVLGEVTSPFLGIYTTYSILDDILN